MLRSVGLTVVLAIVVQHVVRFWFFMDYHKAGTIIHHRPGPCRPLAGADGGSEDLTVLDNGLTFISSGYFPWTRGRILLFDFSDPLHEVKELPIVSSTLNQSDFNVHGLSVWQDNITGEVTLMVINHAGPGDVVEVFTFQEDSRSLLHIKTITCPKRTNMNDLVLTSNRTFYITKITTLRDYPMVELLLMLKYGEVLYYDGSDFRSVAGRLNLPNGINVSPDHRYMYVAEMESKLLKSYRIVDYGLHFVEDLRLDTLVDNIEVDPVSGDLWVGCHPSFHRLIQLNVAGLLLPSQILKVKTSGGKFTEAVEVYTDSGSELSASSVASIYKGKMIAGTIASQLIVCDVVYID
ncbi:serum paraoxonase/arylesterase 1-like [Mizuhopecten yessoensis]|uniref:serum paraoxonase/arylesterase 1-like n=1 Tax=Mizuhopecten yessoensis TaxID=6573 RepID=UPI000B45E100|nr:serum paraoxonase/arylesterase 1-like [Mizuhopecten yessoensis]